MSEGRNIKTYKLSAYTTPLIEVSQMMDFVEYGADNNYFNYLIDRSLYSTTNQSIINGINRMIYGKGLDALDSSKKPHQYAKFKGLIRPRDVRKIVSDRKRLAMAAIQVTYKGGELSTVTHFPMETLRPAKANEDGIIPLWFYHPNWVEYRRGDDLVEIPVFGSTKQKETEIYIIREYVSGHFYFSPPDYAGCLPYTVLEEEISNYLINDVKNGFSGTKVVNFNNGQPDDEMKRRIENSVIADMTGSLGKKVIVSFNDNAESATTVEDLSIDNAPEHYQYLADQCEQKIIVGHRITSPLLVGVRSGNSGLGSNADEIKNASLLQDNVLIRTYQQEIAEAFEEILLVDKISLKLYFKTVQPLEFIDTDGMGKEEKEEATGQKLSAVKTELEGVDLLTEFNSEIQDYEDYHIIDEYYEDEEISNTKLMKQIIVNFVSTGKAIPNAKSNQDTILENGDSFLTRYRYATGRKNTKTGTSREFCKSMLSANKLYRKEDIDRMAHMPVNPGFGPDGARVYDIFKYSGGANCSHMWHKVVLLKKLDSSETTVIGRDRAKRMGYKPVQNSIEVATPSYYLPNHGYLK